MREALSEIQEKKEELYDMISVTVNSVNAIIGQWVRMALVSTHPPPPPPPPPTSHIAGNPRSPPPAQALPPSTYCIGDDSLAQAALRKFLGVGNAMGLQFKDDAWGAGILTSPISVTFKAFPMTASIHVFDIIFDEILMAVLLQACIGGSADLFRVQRITSFCFRFFVPSVASMELLLRQPSIKAKRFTLIFDHIDDAPQSTSAFNSFIDPAKDEPASSQDGNESHLCSTAPPVANPLRDQDPACNEVRLARSGFAFKSFVLQHYHSGVVYPLFSFRHTAKSVCFWISFISEKAAPCAFIVKNMLDHHFSGSDAFDVSHVHGCIYRTIVASASIKSEILFTSPIVRPGISFFLSSSLENAYLAVTENSNSKTKAEAASTQPILHLGRQQSLLGREPTRLAFKPLPDNAAASPYTQCRAIEAPLLQSSALPPSPEAISPLDRGDALSLPLCAVLSRQKETVKTQYPAVSTLSETTVKSTGNIAPAVHQNPTIGSTGQPSNTVEHDHGKKAIHCSPTAASPAYQQVECLDRETIQLRQPLD
jgi:hypothetical protein